MPNVLIYKPLLINLIQKRISYCVSGTSLVIPLTEKQINVLIIFQAKPYYCSIQFSQSLGDVTENNVLPPHNNFTGSIWVVPSSSRSPCMQMQYHRKKVVISRSSLKQNSADTYKRRVSKIPISMSMSPLLISDKFVDTGCAQGMCMPQAELNAGSLTSRKNELSFTDIQTLKHGIKTPLLACVTNVFSSVFPLGILPSNKDQELLFRKQNPLCKRNSDSTEAMAYLVHLLLGHAKFVVT